MSKSALITGITGQDGSYLAEHLLAQGYTVHGLVRRTSMFNRSRIDQLRSPGDRPGRTPGSPQGTTVPASNRLKLHYGDLNDVTSFRRLLRSTLPTEVYHLAGQSHVGLSFEIPEVTCQENGMATLGLLEAMRDLDYPVKFYHAGSSELFGSPAASPQTAATAFNPVNPYGCAKAFATQLCRVYRSAYGVFACSGIAYNHESPRRGENFVTRKISLGAARIKAGRQTEIALGNLDGRRDWGWAPEYVSAMHLMLQQRQAEDFILATGKACSVREFATAAFREIELELAFEGTGTAEVGRRTDTGAVVLRVDPKFYRPLESSMLIGDATPAREKLGWSAKTVGMDVARQMARADSAALSARVGVGVTPAQIAELRDDGR
ncbi:MAG: GDP-mannose 4,6-dehydratase [Lacunisphaera sp.]|nr:GDP-mannose 4,6-dehydratase [Lacunisphaera sp.]